MPEQLTDAQVAEWLELAEAATRGPWAYFQSPKYGEHHVGVPADESVTMKIGLFRDGCPTGEADATFIAAARSAVPALAREVQRLRAEIAEDQRNAAAYHCRSDEPFWQNTDV